MSFAVASLLARAPIEISSTAEVATSFPNFLDVATDVGLKSPDRAVSRSDSDRSFPSSRSTDPAARARARSAAG